MDYDVYFFINTFWYVIYGVAIWMGLSLLIKIIELTKNIYKRIKRHG